MTQARARTRTTRSRVERTNYEATVPPPLTYDISENIEMFSVLKEIDPTFYELKCETIYFEFWENTQEVSISRARRRV